MVGVESNDGKIETTNLNKIQTRKKSYIYITFSAFISVCPSVGGCIGHTSAFYDVNIARTYIPAK